MRVLYPNCHIDQIAKLGPARQHAEAACSLLGTGYSVFPSDRERDSF
jgi:hypothetical protein